jgi:RNA polymerase sigma factor (sigma-70 family)
MPTVQCAKPVPAVVVLPPRRRPFLSTWPAEDLVIAAQAGDADAAGELYRRTCGRARRAAMAFCRADDAEDAVAEGLSRALRRLGQLRDPAAVEGWLVRCAVRAAADLARQRRRQQMVEEALIAAASPETTVESVAERVMASFERHAMGEAVAGLPPALRRLLFLRYAAGLSVDDIALRLGRPAGTVRRQCVEARRAAGQRFLYRQLCPASAVTCRRVTENLCRIPYRVPGPRLRRKTSEHLRSCHACCERMQELARLLGELGYRPRTDVSLLGDRVVPKS